MTYHAATLAGAIPTLLNPTYREREVRYQLENSGAVLLITDGGNIEGINLAGLPNLRRVYTTRQPASGAEPFANLFHAGAAGYPKPDQSSEQTLAALPYSSGTTGLPKGVMLSHYNLIANVYQLLGPNGSALNSRDNILCCLPLYHIYGLNVILNPTLILGAKLVLVPRFSVPMALKLLVDEAITTAAAGAARNQRPLSSGRGRTIPARSSSAMDQVWSRAAGSRSGSPFHRRNQHSSVPGIRHDRGLARHPCRISRARTLSSRLHRSSARGHRLSRAVTVRYRSRRHARRSDRSTLRPARRTGDAWSAIHARLLEGTGSHGGGVA